MKFGIYQHSYVSHLENQVTYLMARVADLTSQLVTANGFPAPVMSTATPRQDASGSRTSRKSWRTVAAEFEREDAKRAQAKREAEQSSE